MANGFSAQQSDGDTKGGPGWQWREDLWARPDLAGYELYVIDRGGGHADIRAYAGVGDGHTDNTESFELAIESIVSSRSGAGTLLVADGRYVVGANITIPEQITLIVRQGARIVPAEGVVVRINGPIEAGPYRIFEGGSASVPTEPPRVNAVVVTPAAFSLEPPNTRQLAAQALDSQGAVIPGAAFSWSSDNTAVATVNSAGLVTAVAVGTATITARSGGVDGTSMVTVEVIPDPPDLARIDVTPSSATIEDGQTQQFNADGFDSAGGAVAITPAWASTDTNVATVDASGLATAVAPGQCMITATDTGVQGAATLNVTTVAAPEVTTIVVTPTQVSIEETETVQLTAQAFDQFGDEVMGVQFLWRSSNTSRATVDQTGLVTAVAPGSVTITATANSVDGTASVNVLSPPGDVTPLFAEDFESYAVGTNVGGKSGPGTLRYLSSFHSIVVSDDHSFSGNKSLRIDYPGEPDLSQTSTRETRFNFWPENDVANAPNEVWVEMMVRCPDNYVHRNSAGSDNNKLFLICNSIPGSFKSSTTRPLMLYEYQFGSETSSFARVGSAAGDVDVNPYGGVTDQVQQIKGNIFTAARRGQWLRLRWHFKVGNPGIVDMWVDNNKVGQMPSDYVTSFPNSGMPQTINGGYFFGWANSGYTEDTNFYVDDFKMWTQDPQWTF